MLKGKWHEELMLIVERPSSDAGPMVGGCYSLRKRVPLMKSPSKSSETQDTLKKQAHGCTVFFSCPFHRLGPLGP